jgi:HEPN domain-containing protein
MTELLTSAPWIATAQTKLAAAESLARHDPDLAAEIGFYSQQAAEFAMKASLIACDANVRRSHDLKLLAADLRLAGADLPEFEGLEDLTAFAVELRYQTPDSVTPEQAREGLALATSIVDWARAHLA